MGKQKTSAEEIEKIVYLRRRGYSLPEIKNITGKAQTTIFRYIKDVKILPEYISEWAGKRGGSRKRKNLKVKKALEEGINYVNILSDREKLFIFCALYWAEGSKKDFGLSNTDPEMIKVLVTVLKDVIGIKPDRIRISLRIYEDLDRNKCLNYWSHIVDIPRDKFVNVNILKGKKHGKLEYGMCRVRIIKGGDILKKVNGINKAIFRLFDVPIA